MLPIRSILWAPTNSAHHNHLHVEGDPRFTGTPPPNNPGMSDSVWTIYVALAERFGEPAYMSGGDWTHMGWYNRRRIAGTSIWSQHSWSNALDIGPYYGVAQQQKFYDFLTTEDDMPLTNDDVDRVANRVLELFTTQPDMPDQDDGIGRRGWTHALKQSWGYSIKAATDAAVARKVVEQLATQPSGAITPAVIDAIGREVAEELKGLRWRLDE